MRREDFAASQRRHVVRAEGGYDAFFPPPLPPDVQFTSDLVTKLSRADRAVGELAGLGRSLPNAHLLAGALLRREAVLSSRIEGTRASLSDLVLFEAEERRSTDVDVAEVLNSIRAIEHVLAPDRRLPLSLPLLLEAHELLLAGVRGGYATPGEFRRSQNWIGPPGSMLAGATYVPPPPERLWESLDAFEKHLHESQVLPPLVTIGCAHYQFEAIHPFTDGNGRVGRLLVMLLMIEWGLLPAPLLDLSAYIEQRRDEYYRRLLAVSREGDWIGWLTYFLEGVAVQASDAAVRARALHQLRDDYRARVTSPRSSALPALLVDQLFDLPAMTIGRAKSVLDVTHRSATLTVERLVGAGILREIESAGRRRLFLADGVLAVVSRSDAID